MPAFLEQNEGILESFRASTGFPCLPRLFVCDLQWGPVGDSESRVKRGRGVGLMGISDLGYVTMRALVTFHISHSDLEMVVQLLGSNTFPPAVSKEQPSPCFWKSCGLRCICACALCACFAFCCVTFYLAILNDTINSIIAFSKYNHWQRGSGGAVWVCYRENEFCGMRCWCGNKFVTLLRCSTFSSLAFFQSCVCHTIEFANCDA